MHERLIWVMLVTLIQREGADPNVLESLYRAVMQAIILYGSEMWVLLGSMAKRIEGMHTEFLQMITGKRGTQL